MLWGLCYGVRSMDTRLVYGIKSRHMYLPIRIYTYVSIHLYIYICTHTYMHACMHIHTEFTCIYIYIYICLGGSCNKRPMQLPFDRRGVCL